MSKITEKSPAQNYNDAFPVGNGRLGAKVYGTPGHEILTLNEESLWSGAYHNRLNPQSLESLDEIQTLVTQERYAEAQELAYEGLAGTPDKCTSYIPSGTVHIDFYDAEHKGMTDSECRSRNNFADADSYKREIDFETGIVSSQFSVEGSVAGQKDFSRTSSDSSITFTRECFASGSGDVIVYHISSNVPNSIYFRANIEKPGCSKKYNLTNDTISVLDANGTPSCIMMTAVASGGTVSVKGEHLIVEKSDYVTLYIDVETGYRRRHYRSKMGDVHKKPLAAASKCADLALKKICFASGTSYENLKADYIAEYSSWNNQALLTVCGKEDPQWDYAKYRLLCSLRPCASVPKTGSGLWIENESEENFNLNDNSIYFYSSGMTGLAGLCQPFHKFIRRLSKHGRSVARKMYGTEGLACHSRTDIWGDAAPCGTELGSSFSPFGALSIARAAVENYEYTLNLREFKKDFKFLREASIFFLENLSPVNEKTELILSPAFTGGWEKSDGEFFYIAKSSGEDSAKIRELFQLTLRGMKYLGVSQADPFAVQLSDAASKLKVNSESNAEPLKADRENFDGWLCAKKDGILKCRSRKGRIELTLLENVPEEWKDGSLKNVQLMGNIIGDIEWKDCKFEKALLHVEPGTAFWKDLTVVYEGKEYTTRLSDNGTLDLRNVLPSTI